MEHEGPNDFVVNPPVSNPNLEFRAEAIKYAEPYTRSHASAIEMNKFNGLVAAGELSDINSGDTEKIEKSLKKLID